MKKYELTPEHRAQLKPWADKWIANAMSTKPMGEEEKQICREAVKGLYRAANLEPPPDQRIVFVSSPFVLRFAGGFAAAIWHLKKSRKKDVAYATDAATDDATVAATDDATRAATDDATVAATAAATAAATDDATRAATYAATDDATYDATRAATDDATYAATYDATYDATDDATVAATDDATRAATYAATYDATDERSKNRWFQWPTDLMVRLSKTLGLAEFGLQCAQSAYNMWQGGNQWSAWVSFLSFFRHIAKLSIDYSKYDHWEKLAIHSGPRIMHEKFCMISDRPSILLVDDQNRPHCDTGPFCQWRDGAALFALHGIRVPAWVVLDPIESWTKEMILEESNAEVRRAILRKLGINRAIELMGAKIVHSKDYSGAKHFQTHEGRAYELLEVDFGTGGKRKYLKMKNASIGDFHIEGVHPDCETVDQALGYREPFNEKEEWRKKSYVYHPPEILT